ncbi:MAG: 12,18-didecarboxysiroheme deacetylase, partial [Deltaproteobacteria bacterium]
MIGISKLYCGTVEPSDALRYGRRSADLPSHLLQFSKDKKPVVVWNITRACNLRCVHCYARAVEETRESELNHKQGLALLDDHIGLSYVGVSLDGMEEVNDRFRGKSGSFQKALTGIRNCQEVGLKVGLRFTINKMNVTEIPGIFDLLE